MKYYVVKYKAKIFIFFRIKKSKIFEALNDALRFIDDANLDKYDLWEINNEKRILIESNREMD